MSKREYYDVLGVQRRAAADELKAAYRKKAKELHPDRNPGDANADQKFKELNEAYDILKDEQKRAAYDQYGHSAFEGPSGQRGGGPGAGFDFSTSFTDVFDDLFGEFMGGRRGGGGGNRAQRGSDLRYNMEITMRTHSRERLFPFVSQDRCHATHAAARAPKLAPSLKHVQPVPALGKFARSRVSSRSKGHAPHARGLAVW